MIRKRYLAACLLSLTIAACSSDSDDNNGSGAPLPAPAGAADDGVDPNAAPEVDPDAIPVGGDTPVDGGVPIPGEETPVVEVPPGGELLPGEVPPGELPPGGPVEVPIEGPDGTIDPPAEIPNAGLIGPSGGLGGGAYVQDNDSPFANVDFSSGYYYLENFEDRFLEHPGASANGGGFVTDTTLDFHDSVDSDDGSIDGNSLNGESWFRGGGNTTVTWTFNASNLEGNLPTHAGIVWTDGRGTIEFEAFGADGQSLGVATGDHADSRFDGATAEDRFYGVINAGGIQSIRLSSSNTGFGLEMDHLQWGYVAP